MIQGLRDIEARGFIGIAKPREPFARQESVDNLVQEQFYDYNDLRDYRGGRFDTAIEEMRHLRWASSNNSVEQLKIRLHEQFGETSVKALEAYLEKMMFLVHGTGDRQTIVVPRMNASRPENALSLYRMLVAEVGALFGEGMVFGAIYVGPVSREMLGPVHKDERGRGRIHTSYMNTTGTAFDS